MERMINIRLVWYLEKLKLITPVQSGFRKQRSTTDQLIRLETFIREAFIHKHHAVAVFFDLEKAYDTTWKYGIMKDLFDAGLRGRLPLFIFGHKWCKVIGRMGKILGALVFVSAVANVSRVLAPENYPRYHFDHLPKERQPSCCPIDQLIRLPSS